MKRQSDLFDAAWVVMLLCAVGATIYIYHLQGIIAEQKQQVADRDARIVQFLGGVWFEEGELGIDCPECFADLPTHAEGCLEEKR